MAKYHDETFVGKTMVMDGNEFVGCVFRDCTLTFNGTEKFSLAACKFTGCRVQYGENVARAIRLMRGLYHGGFPHLMEDLFAQIRSTSPGPHQ